MAKKPNIRKESLQGAILRKLQQQPGQVVPYEQLREDIPDDLDQSVKNCKIRSMHRIVCGLRDLGHNIKVKSKSGYMLLM